MNFNDIDKLVEDYLIFRNYHECAKKLHVERETRSETGKGEDVMGRTSDEKGIRDAIMTALETSDSLRLLTMWDNHVTQGLQNLSSEMIGEARNAEFYLHLYCAIYPFRDDVVRSLKTPAEAAKYAARSMTVFKHYIEARGRRLLKTPEFQGFKNLHKIAFPPTHPTYSYMFRMEWQSMAKNRVSGFLEKFFHVKRAPELYWLLRDVAKSQQETKDMAAREQEIRSVFKKREEKLMDFSRSIYSISNDLLNAIDSGGELNQEFLYKFRLKFDEFHEVLGTDAPPPTRVYPGGKRKRRKYKRKPPHFRDIEYNAMSSDVRAMVAEVCGELTSLGNPGKVLSVIDVEMATGSAMQGCAIINALRTFVTPGGSVVQGGDGDAQESATQGCIAAAKLFMENDVFGLQGGGLPGAATDDGASGFFTTLLQVFSASVVVLCGHPYSREVTKRAKHKSMSDNMENHFGELFEAAGALVYSLCRLLAALSVTLSAQELLTKEETSAGFHALYSGLVDVLMSLPVSGKSLEDHEIIKDLRVVLLLALVTLIHERKHRLTIVKKGLMEWIANTMTAISEKSDEGASDKGMMSRVDGDTFLLCTVLMNGIVENSEAFRAVVASTRAMGACRLLFQLLSNVLLGNTTVNVGSRQAVLVRVCLRSVNSMVSDKIVLDVLHQEFDGLVGLLQNHVKQYADAEEKTILENDDDICVNEMRVFSKHIIRVTGGLSNSGGDDVVSLYSDAHKMKSMMESTSFLPVILRDILSSLPDDMNTVEYSTDHPKETGLIVLISYSKAYREDHGSYETMVEGDGQPEEEDDEEEYSKSEEIKLMAAEMAGL